MENQAELFKGELMEELIRNYFLSLGYYVARGVKFKYEGIDVTDVDLFLYSRSSSLTRQRINVDAKNKKTPQAFERILWANGLMKLLNFDFCVVATTDTKPVTQAFGGLQGTTILDGYFLSKLKNSTLPQDRLFEEDILTQLAAYKSHSTFNNKDWKAIYELSKSRLLTEMDFSGFNETLTVMNYFIEKSLTDAQKRSNSVRMIYLLMSHLMITLDFILKDVAFLEQKGREKRISDGFNFGNLGRAGADKILSIATRIAGKTSPNSLLQALDSAPSKILTDFFGKNDVAKDLFLWAKEFEILGFKKQVLNPDGLDTPLKGVLSVFLDFFGIERKQFFEATRLSYTDSV